MGKVAWIGIALVAAVAGGWYAFRGPDPPPAWRLAKVERGELRVTVTATGTIQPVTLVQVGTQVTGTIQKLLADYNSRVTAGQVVAQIDPAPFQARVDQDRANVARAQADVERVRAGLAQAEKELARARELAKRDLISGSELDAAIAAHATLAAQLRVAEASVDQARAVLQISEVNLRYTTIVSPIDGIVVAREVDVGQTVAASLSAPTIYTIADDMKNVEVEVSVAEADIGRIAGGQDVSFTVDAHRDARFRGRVSQIRLQPTTVQNVVTYTVVVAAENPGGKLLPGMTANATFEVARLADVLKVPNAALRFSPPGDAAPSDQRPRPPSGGAGAGRGFESRIWIPGPEGPQLVGVTAGATDGAATAIVQGNLAEGQEVITGLQTDNGNRSLTNPFGPQWGRRR